MHKVKGQHGNERVVMQISSGQGPDECELTVAKLFDNLCREYPDIELIDKSLRFYGRSELRLLEGSIQWVRQSPFRPIYNFKTNKNR